MANIDLRLGDCLELMRDIPDKSIDLIVTDPPYMMTDANCDNSGGLDIAAISSEIRRIIKDGAAWIVFGQVRSITDWVCNNSRYYKYSIVWAKNRHSGYLDAKIRPLRKYELINVFGAGRVTYNPQMVDGKPYAIKRGGKSECYATGSERVSTISDGKRYPTDILYIGCDTDKDIKHPFKKPAALMEWLVKTYSNPGDTVLDPFMGSGSSGVACVNTGRNYIGMELDAQYFEMAQKRIGEAQCQLVTIS